MLTRRTYNRPKNPEGTIFETWAETVDRVIGHQEWLWVRAQNNRPLNYIQGKELEDLRELMLARKVSMSGRTLWLGGTEIAKKREASQFNCSFSRVETVYDIVDSFWLLMQGCGVGFEPVTGQLHGFTSSDVEIQTIRSDNSKDKGPEANAEFINPAGNWVIRVGDSAEAWAKAAGKLMAQSKPFKKLILDYSNIRAPGIRLKGYGWISSGDETIHKAFLEIAKIRRTAAGRQLTKIEILDVMNWLGTTLSSRRSAEICLMPHGDPEAEEFAAAKRDMYTNGQSQREQSNNSLVFYEKPSRYELRGLFQQMIDSGGSEPGFINGAAALTRAPWFKGVNPCGEILLGHKSFCNLVEVDMGKFIEDFEGLEDAVELAARANYRQTCVDLRDGVLSESWHELNGFLRLCGVGLTGIVKWLDAHHLHKSNPVWLDLEDLGCAASSGMHEMADELGLPPAKAVTTVKPSGTLGKIMDTTEGAHRPLGKYIFNNVNFSKHDPLVKLLTDANYRIMDHPTSTDSVIITLPVKHEGVKFDVVDGLEVNLETAVEQLTRYKLLMDNYVDHNCSITISYDPKEVEEIVEWLDANWDSYVGVSWLFRADPTKTAKDLGYPYLPQEVVTEADYNTYVQLLSPVDLDAANSHDEIGSGDECTGGTCPVR